MFISYHYTTITIMPVFVPKHHKNYSCRKTKKSHHHYYEENASEMHGWNGVSNTLSRILQTVDDVSFRVVDVKKNHQRRKKTKITDDVQGDSKFSQTCISCKK